MAVLRRLAIAASTREELVAYARQQAATAGINPDIFERQIDVESGFNPNAVSGVGAIGIAQIVPQYHPGVDPWDPWDSLRYAAQLMRSHLDRFGSYALALAAYNAGAGAVERYGGVPPYEETQRYIELILGSLPDPGPVEVPGEWWAVAGAAGVGLLLAALLRGRRR